MKKHLARAFVWFVIGITAPLWFPLMIIMVPLGKLIIAWDLDE